MGWGSLRCYMNWPNKNAGQQKLKEGITYETGMTGTSARKPSSKANKGKGYYSKNNAVAWQEHQLAHEQVMKEDMGRIKEEKAYTQAMLS